MKVFEGGYNIEDLNRALTEIENGESSDLNAIHALLEAVTMKAFRSHAKGDTGSVGALLESIRFAEAFSSRYREDDSNPRIAAAQMVYHWAEAIHTIHEAFEETEK